MTEQAKGRVAARLADLYADTHAKARAAVTGPEQAAKHAATEAIMERWERKLAEHGQVMFADLLADPDCPADLAAQLKPLVDPGRQTDFLLNLLTLPLALFSIANAVQSGNVAKWQAWGLSKIPETRLSGAELAELVVRGVETQDDAAHMALDVGLAGWRFDRLVAISGNPPGPEELLLAYRRGLIDRARLEHGIRQSRIKNEWIDVVEALQYRPAGVGEAIAAAVQGHLDPETSKHKAAEAGLSPDDWQWIYETAGNPPGPEHMIDLMHRGVLSRQQVEQGLRESRLKNKYIDAMLDGGYHLPPMRTVISLGHKGLLTKDQVLTKLLALGFHPEDAAVMATEATSDKLVREKDLARSQVVDGYMDRLYDRGAATGMLTDLGYDRDEAGFLLDLADHARQRRFTDGAVARFHSLFVRWKISRSDCSVALDQLGVPAAQRDDLLKLWDLERTADAPDLSVAQWGGLLRRGVIDVDRHQAEMVKRGYTAEEATFLAALAFPPGA
jgi:hypothetical protein